MTLGIFMLIMLGLLFLIGSMDLMTPSTISREGQKIWFMKTIPMSYRDQLRAKIASIEQSRASHRKSMEWVEQKYG